MAISQLIIITEIIRMSLEFKSISTLEAKRRKYFWLVLVGIIFLCWKSYSLEFKVNNSESEHVCPGSDPDYLWTTHTMPPPIPVGYETGPEIITDELGKWLDNIGSIEE